MTDTTVYHFDVVPASNGGVNASYDQLKQHAQQYFGGADIVWMMTCSALVFLMIPGISFFYSGLSDRKSAISLARLPLMTTTVVGCQWFIFGYSLAFSPAPDGSNNKWSFWGMSNGMLFRDVSARPVGNDLGPKIPELVYALYQGMFACFTASLVSGVTFRKFRSGRFLVFIFFWSTLVYDPMARWSWHFQGWSKQMGALDFAGGTPVHICSGAAVGAYAVFFGLKVKLSRQGERKATRKAHLESHKEHNVTYVIIGTALLWFGWLGFNGGSALGANLRAVSACMSTHVAACSGGLTGLLIYMAEKYERKWRSQPGCRESTSERSERSDKLSTVAFCDGVIVGLVAITPGAGYVPVYYAPFFGIVASVTVEFWKSLFQGIASHFDNAYLDIFLIRYDVLEISIVHGGAGFVGMFLTAFLKRDWVVGLDGYTKLPPQSNNHGHQLGIQLGDAVAGAVYSFSITFALLGVLSLPRLIFKKWRGLELDVKPLDHEIYAAELQEYRSETS